MKRSSARILLIVAAVAIFVFSSVGIASASVGVDLSNSFGQVVVLSGGIARQLAGTESVVAVLPSTSTAANLGLLTVGAGLVATLGGFFLLRRQRPQ